MTIAAGDALSLLEWKRRVFDLYARVRAERDSEAAHDLWVNTRHELFTTHEQSPIPAGDRARYLGRYFPYDPAFRTVAEVTATEPRSYEIATSGTETMRFTRIGRATFALDGTAMSLEIYWLDAYGGGLFVPFRDETSGDRTYGAGRYLLDTVKGADLGMDGDKLALDFNFAYNPSCAYDPRWVCPLAPPANRLDIAIGAGEKTPAP